MRIAFISPSFYPAFYYGGPIFSSYNTAKEIAKFGIPVYVTTTNINGKEKLDKETNRFLKEEENLFIKYHSAATSNGFSPFMLWGLWKDISSADAVYTQSVFSSSTILVLLYSAILKKPVLFSPRGQLGEWCLKTGSSFKKLWLNLFIKPFAYSINWHVTADQEREELLAVYPGVNVNVIPNGIDLKQFHNISDTKDRSFYNRYSNGVTFKKVIISMGRLHKKKGFDILIEAFDKVRKLYPDAALFIAGEDYGEKQNLSDLIRNTGLNKNVFLTGQINDNDEKLKFFSNADVFALASHNENFGIVYAEALAAGTPIVASKDTPWQIVETNNCGKWVNNNAESFFIAIGELLNSDLAMLRKNGIKLVEERYGWTSIAKQFNIVFNNLTSKVNE